MEKKKKKKMQSSIVRCTQKLFHFVRFLLAYERLGGGFQPRLDRLRLALADRLWTDNKNQVRAASAHQMMTAIDVVSVRFSVQKLSTVGEGEGSMCGEKTPMRHRDTT